MRRSSASPMGLPCRRPGGISAAPRRTSKRARYMGWFDAYGYVLKGLETSYRAVDALHGAAHRYPLAARHRSYLERLDERYQAVLWQEGTPLWHDLVDALQPDIVIASVGADHIAAITFPSFAPAEDRLQRRQSSPFAIRPAAGNCRVAYHPAFRDGARSPDAVRLDQLRRPHPRRCRDRPGCLCMTAAVSSSSCIRRRASARRGRLAHLEPERAPSAQVPPSPGRYVRGGQTREGELWFGRSGNPTRALWPTFDSGPPWRTGVSL